MTTLQNALELIEGYAAGRRRFRRADLDEANLCCFDLSGIDLVWSNLNWAYLWKTGLRGADLSGANLYEANLRGADQGPPYRGVPDRVRW